MKNNDYDFFKKLDTEEMSELIEKYDTDVNDKIKASVKEKAFKKAGLEMPENNVKRLRPAKKQIFAIAACLCVVLVSVAVGMTLRNTTVKPSITTEPTAESTTVKKDMTNPLMLAISKGDDSLIDSLLKNSIFLNSDVLNYAVDCINILSYNTVGKLARAVYDTFGTTGLDPLVEKTLLGDSQGAIAELDKKENAFSTYTDRLAFFFSVVFCDSDTVDSFIKKGADINSHDSAGNSVYQLAVKYGNEENKAYAEAHGIR